MQKHNLSENMHMDGYFVEYANNFFKGKNLEMRVFYTDKGQCIIGYKIENASVFEKKFVTAKHLMYSLHHYGTYFWYEISIINCEENFNKITLEHMEDDAEIVEGAEPYIIEFHH